MRFAEARRTHGRNRLALAVAAAAAVAWWPTPALAADINWSNAAGGDFSTPGNWVGGVVPGPVDFAHFFVAAAGTGPTYTVNFTNSPTTRGMYVHRDNVTWNLNGNTYTQSGSTAFDVFLVGQNAGETGALTINNGTVTTSSATGTFNTVIGKAGNGTVTLNNAASWNLVNTHVLLAQNAGTSGTFNLNAGSAANLGGGLFLGGSASAAGGTGIVNLQGGSLTVNGALKLWNTGAAAPGGTRFNFSAGSLTAGSIDTTANPARFNWTGGALLVTSSDFAFDSITASSFTLNAGQSLSTLQNEIVGAGGAPRSVTHIGGNNTVGTVAQPRNLTIGAGSAGTYTLNNTATLNVTGNEIVGSTTSGTVQQFGGTHTVAGNIQVGVPSGIDGNFTANGGLISAANFYIGGISSPGGRVTVGLGGAYVQVPGTVRVNLSTDPFFDNQLGIGGGTLDVGTLLVPGTSNFSWTGGTIISASSVSVSQGAAIAGDSTIYTDGTLTLTNTKSLLTSGSERIGTVAGSFGTGSLLLTGGSNIVTGALEIAHGAGSTGAYTLQNGNLSAAGMYVGGNASASGGTGTLSISGGSAFTNGIVRVWNAGSGINLSGGTLSVGSLDLGGVPSRLNWTGGTLAFNGGDVTVDSAFALGETISIGTGRTLNVSAGALNNQGTIILAGGTISATGVGVINNALISGYGTIGGAGGMNNLSLLSQGAGHITYSNTSGLFNDGTIRLAGGYQFNLTAGGLTNNGTVEMNNGTLAASGPSATIANTALGVISGAGTITGPLINSGMIDLPTGTLHTPSFTNAGVIALGSNGANLAGGVTITNNGTLEGVGKVVAAVINNNTIQTGAGTLWFATAPNNTSAGTIVAGAGGKILITAVPSNNAGTIVLAGGTLDVNNQGFTNGSSGHITGYGTIRAAALTNNGGGTITFTNPAGALIFGNVTNKSTSTMIVTGNATATFNNNVTNQSGSEFRVSTGATAVFLGAVTGTGSFTGSGTKIFESGSSASLASLDTTGSTIVESGASLTAGHVREESLTVRGSVNITPNGAAAGASRLAALTITGAAGRLDLADNKLITATPAGASSGGGTYSGLQGDVQRAYDFGAWDLPGLTTSMPDAAAGLTTIGIATGEQIRGLGPTDTDTFAGQTITGASTIAMYTYAGDANLDGVIDGGDYGTIDNFIQVPAADGYANGDFNYDGVIDGGDYGVIDNNIQAQGAPFPTSASAEPLAGVTAVPEPGVGVGMAVALASLLSRRRRRPRASAANS